MACRLVAAPHLPQPAWRPAAIAHRRCPDGETALPHGEGAQLVIGDVHAAAGRASMSPVSTWAGDTAQAAALSAALRRLGVRALEAASAAALLRDIAAPCIHAPGERQWWG